MNANLRITNAKVIYAELSYEITGALFEVHNKLGRFCNEKQYCDELEQEFKKRGIKFEREKSLPKSFEAEKEGRNKVDFLIEDKIVLEVKAKRIFTRDDYYQTRRYLSALNKKLALVVNFRDKFLKPRRVLNSNSQEEHD